MIGCIVFRHGTSKILRMANVVLECPTKDNDAKRRCQPFKYDAKHSHDMSINDVSLENRARSYKVSNSDSLRKIFGVVCCLWVRCCSVTFCDESHRESTPTNTMEGAPLLMDAFPSWIMSALWRMDMVLGANQTVSSGSFMECAVLHQWEPQWVLYACVCPFVWVMMLYVRIYLLLGAIPFSGSFQWFSFEFPSIK